MAAPRIPFDNDFSAPDRARARRHGGEVGRRSPRRGARLSDGLTRQREAKPRRPPSALALYIKDGRASRGSPASDQMETRLVDVAVRWRASCAAN